MSSTQTHARQRLEELYLRLERPLFNVVYRYLWSRDDAQEVVQDTFLRLWDKRADLDWDRAPGLAYRIALGKASNRRRAFAIRSALFGARDDEATVDAQPSPTATPDEALLLRQLDGAARRAIDALPDKLRSVLTLCLFSGLDYPQIAEILEVPVGTVSSRRNEALARLRATLEQVSHERAS